MKNVTPIPFVRARFFDRCGKPLAGGKVYTYEANTTTPKVTYKDPYGLAPNTNPIVLDAAGEADIYLNGVYRIIIKTAKDVVVNDVDKLGSWYSSDLQETLDSISDAMDTAIQQPLQDLQDAIDIAAAAGAGANGWTDLLIATQSGRTQREKNLEYATINDYQGEDTAEQLFTALSDDRLIEIRQTFNAEFTDPNKAEIVLSKLENLIVNAPTTITLPASTLTFNSDYIAKYTQDHALLTIKGAEPAVATINNVVSSTGGDGNWTVVYQLADASNVNVGDYLKIDKVACGAAWFESTPVRKAHSGELAVGMNKMGTATTTGTTMALGSVGVNGIPSNWLEVGYLIHFKGQTREVVSFDDTARTVTVSSAFNSGSAEDEFDTDNLNFQWWYYSKPDVGTISVVGQNITGVGTNFLSTVDEGDLILFNGCMVQVKTVSSNTQLTINILAFHNTVGTKYSIVKCGLIAHEGTWEVVSKSGNQVTVSMKCWNGYQVEVRHKVNNDLIFPYFAGFAPTVKGWVGANVKVMKSVLRQTKSAGHGFVGEQGGQLKLLDNIVVKGTTTGTGLLLKGIGGSYDAIQSSLRLGDNVAINGFNNNVWGFAGSSIHAPSAHFVGATANAVHLGDGGSGYLRGAVIAGAGGMGCFIAGNYIRLSTCRIIGCKSQGLRTDAGGFFYSDSGFIYGCASHGVMAVNISGGQFVDGFTIANGGNGINTQNCGTGRYTRNLAACNKNHGISFTASVVEAGQCWATGSGSGALGGRSGIVANNSQVGLFHGTSTGNPSAGLLALDGARVSARMCHLSKNGQSGASISQLSNIVGVGGYALGNYGATQVILSTGSEATGIVETTTTDNSQLVGGLYTTSTAIPNGGVITFNKNSIYAYVYGDVVISGSTDSALWGRVYTRWGSSPQAVKREGHANLEASIGIKDGTNGTAGKLIVSPAEDGKLYIANQTGTAVNITVTLFGRFL